MVHILYLAAGSGRRFGANKLLAELKGKPLFRHGLDTLHQFAAGRRGCTVTVVSRYEEILAAARALGLRGVNSPDSAQGIAHTIRAGIGSLPALEAGDSLLFVLADQPRLTGEALGRMLDAAATGCTAATAVFAGVPGSPTLFSAQLIPALLALTGDEGGRKVLKQLPEVVQVEMPSALCLQDVDRPADLEELSSQPD